MIIRINAEADPKARKLSRSQKSSSILEKGSAREPVSSVHMC